MNCPMYPMISFKENQSRKLHFLNGFWNCVELKFHKDFSKRIDTPCKRELGEERCQYCEKPTDKMQEKSRYCFFVYDVDKAEIGIIATMESEMSLLPVLVELADNTDNGEIEGKTFVFDRVGYTKDSKFFGVRADKDYKWTGDEAKDSDLTNEILKFNVLAFFVK